VRIILSRVVDVVTQQAEHLVQQLVDVGILHKPLRVSLVAVFVIMFVTLHQDALLWVR
jgi:hypothetical protein